MKKITSSIALIAVASNFLIAGGNILEPEVSMPEKEVVIIDDNVKYNGFYLGGAVTHMRMNEVVTASGYAFTVLGGYYLNKYVGFEARYSFTFTDLDVDNGPRIVSTGDDLSNLGLYIKPMYNVTTGFSLYGLAGYGQATYEKDGDEYSEDGFQWGLGAKYELSNNVGLFIDYLDIYDDSNFDGIIVPDATLNAVNVGAAYTF